jgi:type II secretory pathway component GspD/PulD (secretin)
MRVRKKRLAGIAGIILILLFASMATAAAAVQRISMNYQDADVREVLTSLAEAEGVNIVIDDSVKGNISLNLNNVPVTEALDLIVRTKGFTCSRMPDGTIVVSGAKTMLDGFGSPTVFPLKYAVASDLKKTLSGTFDDKRLKADDATNSLVFFGSPAETAELAKVLKSLDVPVRQVTIEAEVLEIDKTASKQLGLDWTFAPGPLQAAATDSQYLPNEGAISFGQAPNGAGPYQFRFQAQLSALISKGDAKVLAKPKISTISGKEAKILIGDQVPVQSQTTTNGTTSTTVTYVDTGIMLQYTPVISPDGLVRAHLLAEVSTPSAALGGTNYQIQTRTAETDMVMHDGQTMVIGGLLSSNTSRSGNSVPFLSDLPLIGNLFKSHNDSDSETQVVVMLTAHIVK